MGEKDPGGLFDWYQAKFYPRIKPDAPFERKRLFGRLRQLQDAYNRSSGTPCIGLSYMRRQDARQYCRRPLCPSCWHIRQAAIFAHLHQLESWGGHFYLRHSWQVHWRDELAPALLKRFKVRRPECRMLFYTLNFDSCTRGEISSTDIESDEFEGELSYSITGLFHSHTPLKEYGTDPAHQVHVFGQSALLGAIHREELHPSEVAEAWRNQLSHPWLYQKHQLFQQYLQEFDPQNIGRSWTRFNKAYFKEK